MRTVTILLLTAVLPSTLLAGERYFHLKVESRIGAEKSVEMNLPVSVLAKAAPLFPDRPVRARRIELCGYRIKVSEFRQTWRTLAEGRVVDLAQNDTRLRIHKSGGWFIAEASNHEQARVRIPAPVIDALLDSSGDRLNFAAAAQTLAASRNGEVMSVVTDDDVVRMWIDESPRGW